MQRLFEGGIYLKVGRDFEDYIRAAVLTRGWRFLSFWSPNVALIWGQHVIGGGAHSNEYGILPIQKKKQWLISLDVDSP